MSQRPIAEGRRDAVFVFSSLRVDGGRLTQGWLARMRAFADGGWSTHAVITNRSADLERTVETLTGDGRMPAGTTVHHYAARDRLIRPSWRTALPPGTVIDPRVGDWLDWITGRIPGAVVFADSPATYPYVAQMGNPTVTRVAVIHLNHLASSSATLDPATAPLSERFAARFDPFHGAFDAVVVKTQQQADDLRARYGPGLPVAVIPPGLAPPAPGADRPDTNDPATDAAAPVGESPATEAAGPGVAGPDGGAPAAQAPRVVCVGALEEGMRHADAIRALAACRDEAPAALLDIVGEGSLADALRDEAQRAGVADRVRFIAPGPDPYTPFRGAIATVWPGRREAYPGSIVRSLAVGVPVIARHVRYGPAELVTSPELGALYSGTEQLQRAMGRLLARPSDPGLVSAAAREVVARSSPARTTTQWLELAGQLQTGSPSPTLLVEEMRTTARVPRMPGVLAGATSELSLWTCERPELQTPAGWLSERTQQLADQQEPDEERGSAQGSNREVTIELRTNALAFAALELGEPYRVEFTDGTTTTPLLATAFEDRVLASRIGNATLSRRPDGTVWVAPLAQVVTAEHVDGRAFVRSRPESAPSDVTYAIAWNIQLDWTQLHVVGEHVEFTGTLHARNIVPSEESTPRICVTDVGGFSRVVGTLERIAEPTLEGADWRVALRGSLDVPALVATTELARGTLSLHVGYAGLRTPMGVLWTQGRRDHLCVVCSRGEMTLLPSAGGRVLAAPGKGLRARASRQLRSLVRRG